VTEMTESDGVLGCCGNVVLWISELHWCSPKLGERVYLGETCLASQTCHPPIDHHQSGNRMIHHIRNRPFLLQRRQCNFLDVLADFIFI
jgi:hypothetical protein